MFFKNDPHKHKLLHKIISRQTKKVSIFEGEYRNKDLMEAINDEHEDSTKGTVVMKIHSTEGLVQWLKDEVNTETKMNSSADRGSGFSSSENMEHAMTIAENGTPELLKSIRDKSEKITKESTGLVHAPYDIRRDVEGMFFDVGLFMEGEPEAFFQEADSLIPDRCLNVDLVASYPAFTQASHAENELVHILAAINILELNGYRVKITLWWNSVQDDEYPNLVCYYPIKEYRESLNLARLVGTTHPAFFRRLVFRIKELNNAADSGYGRTIGDDKDRCNVLCLGDTNGEVKDIIKFIKESNNVVDSK